MTPLQANDIRNMEKVCRLAADTLKHIASFVLPGISTLELDQIARDYIYSNGARPAPLNYNGYPKSICTSVNDVICHGIPDTTILKEGDIINIDITPVLNGFHGDTSATFMIGTISERAKNIVTCVYEAMHKGIEAIMPWGSTGDIGFAINKHVLRHGYHVVKEIGGHGIGLKFHDEPFVPSYGKKGKGSPLTPFTCITVEPMVNETDVPMKEFPIADSTIKYYKTGDGSLSAQFEHTVLITDKGYEILTLAD